eukprot:sb/3465149/
MKGFAGVVSPYPYFNAKSDAEAIENALILRRGSITSRMKQFFGIEMESNTVLRWVFSLVKSMKPTIENEKTGYCWPYCNSDHVISWRGGSLEGRCGWCLTVYKVQMRHGAFLNQLFKTNPTQPELAFYLIGKVWFTFFIFSCESQSEGWISKFWPLRDKMIKNEDYEEKERFERAVIETLAHRSNVQRQQIAITYKKIYQKDMLEELKICLNGDFQDAVEALITDPVLYDVKLLHRSLFEMLTIDGELLAEILCSRTNVQLMAIQEKYAQEYGNPEDKADNGQPMSLLNDIVKIFTESRLMSDRECAIEFVKKVLLDAYHREWSPKMSPADSQWDEKLARTDAGELYGAGEFKWGTDEGGFINVLFQESVTFAQLRATFDAYERMYGKKVVDVVNEEFSGVLKELVSTYVGG